MLVDIGNLLPKAALDNCYSKFNRTCFSANSKTGNSIKISKPMLCRAVGASPTPQEPSACCAPHLISSCSSSPCTLAACSAAWA